MAITLFKKPVGFGEIAIIDVSGHPLEELLRALPTLLPRVKGTKLHLHLARAATISSAVSPKFDVVVDSTCGKDVAWIYDEDGHIVARVKNLPPLLEG